MTRPQLCARLATLNSAIELLEAQVRYDQHECFASLIDLHAERIRYQDRLRTLDHQFAPAERRAAS
jgi:hypothetical protein